MDGREPWWQAVFHAVWRVPPTPSRMDVMLAAGESEAASAQLKIEADRAARSIDPVGRLVDGIFDE